MSALQLSFPIETLRAVFEKYDIHLLETFPDCQTRWGDRPMEAPFRGRSAIAHPYRVLPGHRVDIFTIRAIVSRLGRGDHLAAIENELYPMAVGDDDAPTASATVH